MRAMDGSNSMLQGGYQAVLEARSREEFRHEVIRFAQSLGFSTVSATVVLDHTVGESEFETVDNTPESFSSVFADRSSWRQDPVMQHCKRHSVPIVWNQKTYVASGQAEMWEEQARFGYHTGIALALHLPEGRHFFLGVDRDSDLPREPVAMTQMVANLQLFAVYAQEAAWRVVMPKGHESVTLPSRLTPRELECLRWTMDGKTAWEVGTILSITERTAVLHLNNAMHKLGCTTKHQAVLKALRMGLIR
ncbi:LuxR family transcriptional regulator [Paucibacter aquatile]|jgi:DNA-binding CsgD family transcriptional regulator|uniref:LuxR family transcriptional regulator n=2 Tax=Roseateles TaxID=93681 RepID=A0A2N8KZL7_9BURK|nr:autoinducer binding domain-containing protein [Paucibacter aquatile]PND38891.1 LuxR family transcriptional regulator [Paucibacter aquatile]